MLARVAVGLEVEAFLAATAALVEDASLSAVVAGRPAGTLSPIAERWTRPLLDLAATPLLDGLSDDEQELSTTRRRAAPKVGRNEPCPCGSGRKYKRCCEAKDQERLRDSSDVAGVTRSELRLHLEEHLTLERLRSLRAHELARLDPARIDPVLHGIVLNQLIRFEEWDALLDFFEAVGPDRYDGHVCDAADGALRAGRLDMLRRFAKMAPESSEEWLGFYPRLVRSGIEDSPALDVLEAEARRTLDGSTVDLACDLLDSPWPSLGILVARGAAPLAGPLDRETVLEDIGLARDRLDLPPVDPTEELEDFWDVSDEEGLYDGLPLAGLRPGAGQAAAPVRDDLERTLADKEVELGRLRQELSTLHRKLDERMAAAVERTPAPSPAEPVAVPEPSGAQDPRVAKLKERVSALKTELSLRHAERNQLRRQLERTSKRVDALEAERESGASAPTEVAEDDGDSFTEPDDPSLGVALSFRIPVFGRRFRASAGSLPEPVRRRAVVVASRIAAGDEAAFRGTRRLRVDRELYRQRVGRDHRLIFRMHAEELEAVDLVPRKDLERTVRELARG
jgi:hypothetical protein